MAVLEVPHVEAHLGISGAVDHALDPIAAPARGELE
jgi:hypothetical protein